MPPQPKPPHDGTWLARVFEAAATPMLVLGPGGEVLAANPASERWTEAAHLGDLAGSPAGQLRLQDGLHQVWAGYDARVRLDSGAVVALRPLGGGLALAEGVGEPGGASAPTPGPAEQLTFDVRTAMGQLVGHLELLREMALAEAARARAGAALDAAEAVSRALGLVSEPPPPPPADAEAGALPRVLVVDDDPANRALLLGMLDVLGVEARAVADAEGALGALDAEPADVVLMDVMLPGVDGIEATRRLRARPGPQPTVVGLTALPDARAACLEAGMDTFLTKPVRLRTLSATLAAEGPLGPRPRPPRGP